MTAASILFVDDEPNLLEGLKRMLRPYHGEWRMAFVTSGAAALEMLEREHFDVVVTDVGMPGMDGATLLEQLDQRYPDVTRIVLSGHAEQQSLRRTTALAHRYLSKPCDADTLRAEVAQALKWRTPAPDTGAAGLAADVQTAPGPILADGVATSPLRRPVETWSVNPALPATVPILAKVLFVDDEPAVLETFRRMLKSSQAHASVQDVPFTVYIATRGEDAIALLASDGPFAVIVSDLHMPGMDGIQLLERVREIAPATVRIMLTGDADGQAALEAFERGIIFWFVTKPCTCGALTDTISGAIEHHRLLLADGGHESV